MAGPTHDEFPRLDASPAELRRLLIRIADELRRLRCGNQAERIEAIVDLLERPRLGGMLQQVGHPKTWATPEGAVWMAEHLLAGAAIVGELMADAEITGSDQALERAREWLEALGMIPTS